MLSLRKPKRTLKPTTIPRGVWRNRWTFAKATPVGNWPVVAEWVGPGPVLWGEYCSAEIAEQHATESLREWEAKYAGWLAHYGVRYIGPEFLPEAQS